MGIEFTIALIMAVLAFVFALIFGEQIHVWFASVGVAIILVPVFLVLSIGMLAMLNADLETTKTIADSTSAWAITYFVDKLPGVFMSEMAGVLVGTLGGFAVRLAKAF